MLGVAFCKKNLVLNVFYFFDNNEQNFCGFQIFKRSEQLHLQTNLSTGLRRIPPGNYLIAKKVIGLILRVPVLTTPVFLFK